MKDQKKVKDQKVTDAEDAKIVGDILDQLASAIETLSRLTYQSRSVWYLIEGPVIKNAFTRAVCTQAFDRRRRTDYNAVSSILDATPFRSELQ